MKRGVKAMKTRRWMAGAVALAMMTVLGAEVSAQDRILGQMGVDEIKAAKSLIDIDVTDKPIVDVLAYISQEAAVDIVPMPADLTGAVTIKLVKQPWQDVLAIVA